MICSKDNNERWDKGGRGTRNKRCDKDERETRERTKTGYKGNK